MTCFSYFIFKKTVFLAGPFLTLSVEFLAHPLAPLPAQLPNTTRVTDVCTLQSDLLADRGSHSWKVAGKVRRGGAEQVQMHSTCRMKCLCEGSCRSRSWWSRCSLKVNKNSFCLLMSVARMREPSCCSMSCLQGRGGSSEP